jgi:hypothetical protein
MRIPNQSFVGARAQDAMGPGTRWRSRSRRVKRLLMPVLGAVLALAACSGTRSTPSTRYEGILLNGRELGAGELTREAGGDPTVQSYVAQHGNPDFVLAANSTNLELVYVQRSVLAYFHRTSPGVASTVSEVTPLPSALYQLLPPDIRAGTSAPMAVGVPACWTAPVTDGSCRTCCLGTSACTVQCTSAAAR